MAWRRSGDKPLSEPMIIIYRRIYASLGLNELTCLCNSSYPYCFHPTYTHDIYLIYIYIYYIYIVWLYVYTYDFGMLLDAGGTCNNRFLYHFDSIHMVNRLSIETRSALFVILNGICLVPQHISPAKIYMCIYGSCLHAHDHPVTDKWPQQYTYTWDEWVWNYGVAFLKERRKMPDSSRCIPVTCRHRPARQTATTLHNYIK